MVNSTDFNKLRPNQHLFLVRYSHSPKPDFVEVLFRGVINKATEIEFMYINDVKKRLKKFPIRKAKYRLFLHIADFQFINNFMLHTHYHKVNTAGSFFTS